MIHTNEEVHRKETYLQSVQNIKKIFFKYLLNIFLLNKYLKNIQYKMLFYIVTKKMQR